MTSRQNANELDRATSGAVLRPGHEEFDAARSGFQTAYAHRPSVIVRAQTAADVRAAVRHASARGLAVAVSSSGHGLTVPTEGGVLVHTGALTGVWVDPVSRAARVAAGTPWGQVVAAAAEHGLAPLSGSSADVGAVAYCLGGGLGPLAREYGWAADHVRAVELVTADGSLRTVTADSDPELFWAVRGAGANFGVATGLEIGLVPVRRLYGGGLFFDLPLVPDVLAAFREWTASLPEQLTTSLGLVPYPDLPMLPEPLRGRYVAHLRVAFTGSAADGEALVEPMRAVGPRLLDAVGELPYTESPSIYRDPPVPHAYRGTNAMLRDLPEAVPERVLELAGPGSPVPCVVQLNHLGGALGRPPSVPNAVAHREATHLLRVLSVVDGPGPSEAHAAPGRLTDALADWTLGRSPNFVFGERTTPDLARDCYRAEDLPRLARLKAEHDPANLFRFGLPIAPADPVAG